MAAPAYAKAHLNLGIALEATGDAEAATDAYQRASRLEAREPYARYNLGKLSAQSAFLGH